MNEQDMIRTYNNHKSWATGTPFYGEAVCAVMVIFIYSSRHLRRPWLWLGAILKSVCEGELFIIREGRWDCVLCDQHCIDKCEITSCLETVCLVVDIIQGFLY